MKSIRQEHVKEEKKKRIVHNTPSVAIFLMVPLSAPSETIFPIITKVDADAWE
jgi:hypothetical protein